MSQALYPVIMCGGSGTRLWPASRADRPKQFLGLAGERSLFQDTVERVAPLAGEAGKVIVVTGAGYRHWVEGQLQALERDALIILEPEARDSAPAMAAAAAYVAQSDPSGVLVFVASDHHLPEGDGFRDAVKIASGKAKEGFVVTLGVRPSEPSSAYGYIRAAGEGLAPVAAFVEKPDRATAQTYLDQGFLWNSGNFIVRADALLNELATHAPDVGRAAGAALNAAQGGVVELAPVFTEAPRISIDHAVMEKTDKAWVLPVGFTWSDLGAWDAVAATGSGATGTWIGSDGDRCLVRAAPGVLVATAGVSNLAIIAEHDAVLVCDLDRAQEVKGLVERIRAEHPSHVGIGAHAPAPFEQCASDFSTWMRVSALPLWSTLGVEDDGAFTDRMKADGRPVDLPRRARVQTRQVQVYCRAGELGWRGPWREVAGRGLRRFWEMNSREDGRYRTLVARDGQPLNEAATLYDQSFALFAMAAATGAEVEATEARSRALALRDALLSIRLPFGGWPEAGEQPYQANAQMHLLEATLAWEDIDPDPRWREISDEIASLALDHFIAPNSGALREFFSENWTPQPGEEGRLVEPGHQFEWAWLLTRWGARRGRGDAIEAARRLYGVGRKGVDPIRGVAIDALRDDLSVRSGSARLWPQGEWLKAGLLLAETAEGDDRATYVRDAGDALRALQSYLLPNGLWWDRLAGDRRFVEEAAPASSLYHIMSAYDQLATSAKVLPELAGCDLSLG